MSRPLLLDLFCGAGGAAMGYYEAGFDVMGVDIKPQPHYPFEFIQEDALLAVPFNPSRFDAIHASPPCQAYSIASVQQRGAGVEYPDLLAPTRRMLEVMGVPWVIENVPGAPMRADIKLCGCQFDLPMLRRERWFETSWHAFDLRSPCFHVGPALSVTGHGVGAGNGQRGRIRAWLGTDVGPTIEHAKAAMGIDWMNRDELSEAIPPAYTRFIGEQLLEHISSLAPNTTEDREP